MLDFDFLFRGREFWIVTSMLLTIVEIMVIKTILKELYEVKSNKTTFNISLLACMIIGISINLLIKNSILNSIVYVLILIAFTYYNYEVNLLKTIIICTIYICINLISEKGIFFILNYISKNGRVMTINTYYFKMYSEFFINLQSGIFSKLIMISLIPIIKFLKLRYNMTRKEFRYIGMLLSGNILYIVLTIAVFYMEAYDIFFLSIDIFTTVLTCIVILLNIYSINLISRIINDREIILQNEAIKKNIDMQYSYYANMQKSQEDIRKLYHDIKNHMICIENMYGSNDYTENINKQLAKHDNIFNTGNMILDIILSDKKSTCDNLGIQLFVDVNFKKCEFIDIADVCSIFSNMLDNAIEACDKISEDKQKYIKLRGTIVNSLYFIKCENSKVNKISTNKTSIITDKCNKFLHGIGISSIKSSVEKYNGNVEIDYSEGEFIICIYIPIVKNKPQLYS